MARVEMLGGSWGHLNAADVDVYTFAFSPNNTGTPTNLTSRREGAISTCVRAAQGLFTIQMADGQPGTFLGGCCAVVSTTAGTMRGFQAGFDATNAVTTAGTLSVALYGTSNTLADAAAGTGEYVLVTVFFSKNSSATL